MLRKSHGGSRDTEPYQCSRMQDQDLAAFNRKAARIGRYKAQIACDPRQPVDVTNSSNRITNVCAVADRPLRMSRSMSQPPEAVIDDGLSLSAHENAQIWQTKHDNFYRTQIKGLKEFQQRTRRRVGARLDSAQIHVFEEASGTQRRSLETPRRSKMLHGKAEGWSGRHATTSSFPFHAEYAYSIEAAACTQDKSGEHKGDNRSLGRDSKDDAYDLGLHQRAATAATFEGRRRLVNSCVTEEEWRHARLFGRTGSGASTLEAPLPTRLSALPRGGCVPSIIDVGAPCPQPRFPAHFSAGSDDAAALGGRNGSPRKHTQDEPPPHLHGHPGGNTVGIYRGVAPSEAAQRQTELKRRAQHVATNRRIATNNEREKARNRVQRVAERRRSEKLKSRQEETRQVEEAEINMALSADGGRALKERLLLEATWAKVEQGRAEDEKREQCRVEQMRYKTALQAQKRHRMTGIPGKEAVHRPGVSTTLTVV